jgi:predicted phosphodiesterase
VTSLDEFAEAAIPASTVGKARLGKIADLLERSGIDIAEIGSIDKVRISEWQGITKNEDGEAEIHDLGGVSVVINPAWASGPQWPVVQQSAPVIVRHAPKSKKAKSRYRTAVILPDPQIGFRMYEDGSMDPFHDEAAMSVALQILRDLAPDQVVNLGDFLDFAEFGKFEQEPAFAKTTQASVDRGHRFLCQQRANAPDAAITLLEGNHDRRLQKAITNNTAAALHLKRADTPDDWPVMSVPFLLRLGDLDVEYVGGYPAGIYWINQNLACIHGHITRSRGSTVAAVVDDERTSIIHGHIHRIELQHKTRRTFEGAKRSLAASPGCLCRIDGAVPSTKGSTDPHGRPVNATEDWQQGMAVVEYEPGDGNFNVELVPISRGEAIFRGRYYTATATTKEKSQ